MALIRPFKGIIYNQSHIKDLGSVITPPYDIIDSAQQKLLYRSSPYNIIRLEYGISSPDDTENENRYSRAAAILQQWLNQGILEPDDHHNYYIYEQSFTYNQIQYKRRGIITALKLEPYSAGIVLPHELTMAGPKTDRLALLKATHTNISPIFTLFPDPDRRMHEFFAIADHADPTITAVEESGQIHRIWPITDPVLQDQFTAYLATQPLLIADGHHRYETAQNHAQSSPRSNLPGAGFILAVMVSINDPGLLMMPTHRLLHGLDAAQQILLRNIIREHFSVIELGDPAKAVEEDFLAKLEQINREKCGFGCILSDRLGLLVPEAASANEDLPVSLLHDLLLKPLLTSGKNTKDMLSFSHDFAATLDAVKTGKADAAFILDTLPVGDLFQRSRQGMIMPQKSTYFYPKLPSGLVLYNSDLSF